MRTKDCGLSDVEICQRNGWKVGTKLRGREFGKYDTIEIAAIGRETVLAVWDGVQHEQDTALDRRNWRAVEGGA